MNLEDKAWLRNKFPEYQHRTLKGEVLENYYLAEKLLTGADSINRRSCGCNLRGMASQVNKLYDNWLQNNNGKT